MASPQSSRASSPLSTLSHTPILPSSPFDNSHGQNKAVANVIATGSGSEDKLVNISLPSRYSGSYLPTLWSNKRAGICETLRDYRSHQGSLYHKESIARGVLLDKEAERLDILSAQVAIFSVGGGREKDNTGKGEMVRKVDSDDEGTPIKAFKKAFEEHTAILLVVGKEHPHFKPIQYVRGAQYQYGEPLPANYAVCDYFHVTYIWKEPQVSCEGNRISIWRIRLEKCDLHSTSWWDANGCYIRYHEHPHRLVAPCAVCDHCGQESKEIYTKGWTCLNHKCLRYLETLDAMDGHRDGLLEYTTAFLEERTPFIGPCFPIAAMARDLASAGSHGTEETARDGFVCPDCGCCNRRIFWNSLVCEAEGCHYSAEAHLRPYPEEAFRRDLQAFEKRVNRPKVNAGLTNDNPRFDHLAVARNRDCLEMAYQMTLGGYTVTQYMLPSPEGGIIGSFTMFTATDDINRAPYGPNALFRAIESANIGLKRNPATYKGKREELTRHFQQNYGAKYLFGVRVQSKPFSDAPDFILAALQRLTWVANQAVDMTTANAHGYDRTLNPDLPPTQMGNNFNELLALGYRETDMINFHDDGEKELGPTVAALSLGSPSLMKFRPKKKWNFRVEKLSKEYKTVLEVPMKHGDIMVMHGKAIQRFYEHAVIPKGGRRFSMTSRFVDPARMADPADRQLAAVDGAIPGRAAQFTYNGF